MKEIEERLLKALGLIAVIISLISMILVFTEGGPIIFQDFFSSIEVPFIMIWFLLLWAALKRDNKRQIKQNNKKEVINNEE